MRLHAVKPRRLSFCFAIIATLLLTPVVLSAQESIAFESQRDDNPEVYDLLAQTFCGLRRQCGM